MLKNVTAISEIHGLVEPAIKYSPELKRRLIKKFYEQLSFFSLRIVVHLSGTDLCQYRIVVLLLDDSLDVKHLREMVSC